ncbi:MAG: hypothetical protein ACE5H1_03640, partial [Thermodesulfobacteriota bacterium]
IIIKKIKEIKLLFLGYPMNKEILKFGYSIYIIIFTFFCLVFNFGTLFGLEFQNLNINKNNKLKQKLVAEATKEFEAAKKTQSKSPIHTEIKLRSLPGEIFINPKYTGRVLSVEAIKSDGTSLVDKDVDINVVGDSWSGIVVPESSSGHEGLNVVGEKGSLKISLSREESTHGDEGIKSIKKPKIAFGRLSTTFITPEFKITKPSKFEIGIFDYDENKFLSGDIIGLKNNQIAVKFLDLPPSVISKDGKLLVSIKEPDGSFLNSELSAWGYNIFVPDTDIEKSVPITAKVFGLPKEAKIKFTFKPLQSQRFSNTVSILSVNEINAGEPITMITTSIPGVQPLSINVEEAF